MAPTEKTNNGSPQCKPATLPRQHHWLTAGQLYGAGIAISGASRVSSIPQSLGLCHTLGSFLAWWGRDAAHVHFRFVTCNMRAIALGRELPSGPSWADVRACLPFTEWPSAAQAGSYSFMLPSVSGQQSTPASNQWAGRRMSSGWTVLLPCRRFHSVSRLSLDPAFCIPKGEEHHINFFFLMPQTSTKE